MRWVFWSAVIVIAYVYFGYPAWLWLRGHLKPWPVQRGQFTPRVSIVMIVRNEEKVLPGKLQNLAALSYPCEQIEYVVVSDGSTDATADSLRRAAEDGRFHALISQQARSKASGLNDALKVASGEIVVFTDARQQIESDGIWLLIENFADPNVGCVSGELMLGDPGSGQASKGTGLYWLIEKKVRELESLSGSVVGATGAFYAARRELVVPLPEDVILDDVYVPMHIVRQGRRVVFDGRAHAWDTPNLGEKREFSRKVRTLSGNYQLLQLAPWLLTGTNPLRFEFVSHKLLRLLVPFALALALVSSLLVIEPFYRVAAVLQLAFYALSLLGLARVKLGRVTRIADAACTFVLLNTAALVAFKNFVTGRRAAWATSGHDVRKVAGERASSRTSA